MFGNFSIFGNLLLEIDMTVKHLDIMSIYHLGSHEFLALSVY